MKTKTKSRKLFTTDSEAGFLIGFIILVLMTLAFASCSEDDEPAGPDTRSQFVGDYNVEETSDESGNQYKYNVSIRIGSGGDLEISNFGGVINVPVKASANGSQLSIKSQTFTNPSGNSLTVYGSGTLVNDVLTFTYTLTGYSDYTGTYTCTATKE